MLLHDVFMREDVGAACTAFEMPQGVIFTGVSLDHLEACCVAVRTNVFHELKK
jgi:hypothetical protein